MKRRMGSWAYVVVVIGLFVTAAIVSRQHPVDGGGKAGKPAIRSVTASADKIGRYEKLELTVDLLAEYQNPYDPEEVDLHATFTSPKGQVWKVNGFYDGSAWKVRFAPNVAGNWTYRVEVSDPRGKSMSKQAAFNCTEATGHGWVHVSPVNGTYLANDDGTGFYGTGVAYPWDVTQEGLDRLKANGANILTYWNGNYDHAGNGGGVQQLMSPESGPGRIDIAKSKRLDELVGWLDARQMKMSFVIWPHDSLAQALKNWPHAWSLNGFQGFGDAVQFYGNEANWKDQQILYRYIIARWGFSPSIAIWDLIDEINGTDGWSLGDHAKANAWAKRVHDYFAQNDPYRRPTSGSMAGGASDYWSDGYATFDLSDRENYYDLHPAAYAADLRKRWDSFAKPLVIGETGNITDASAFHGALWSSLANGAAMTPIWWAYDKVDANMLEQLKVLSRFVAQLDFTQKNLQPVQVQVPTVEIAKPATVPLETFKDPVDWTEEDWADASKENGALLKPGIAKQGDRETIDLPFAMKSGGYTQGFAGQTPKAMTDWSSYDKLRVDVYLDADASMKRDVFAKAVLFPQGTWDEASDAKSVKLKAGEWVTLEMELADSPATDWRNAPLTPGGLQKMAKWGLKVYANALDSAIPIKVKLANPVLIAGKNPVEVKAAADGYAMLGEKLSFGWLTAADGRVSGQSITISGFANGDYLVKWMDPWTGADLPDGKAAATDGKLSITAPDTAESDVAFRIAPAH